MSTEKPDYVAAAGRAAIGARLRRLSERLDGEARRVYAAEGFVFEQRWLGVLDILSEGPRTVGELAAMLGVSHPSVSETRRSLVGAGLVEGTPDGRDRRRQSLTLTEAGVRLVAELRPLWAVLDTVAVELDSEAGGLTAVLVKLEAALDREPLDRRVARRRPHRAR